MKNTFRKFLIAFVFFPFIASAQTTEQTAWLASFNSIKLSQNLGLHLDVQVRSADDADYVKTAIFRPGLTYFISPKQNVTAGYALIQNSGNPEVPTAFDPTEHRIWEQYLLTYKIGAVPITHRFRLEQRFIERPAADVFSQRLRYFVRALVPLVNSKEAFSKGLFVGLQNELFINVQNNEKVNGHTFDQNRAFASLGYRLNKKVDLELGYLNQQVKGRDKGHSVVNHALQFGVYTRF